MANYTVLAFALVIACTQAVAQNHARRAWEWQDDERIARRLILARAASDEHQLPAEHQWAIDGDVHPELFLPAELSASCTSRFAAL